MSLNNGDIEDIYIGDRFPRCECCGGYVSFIGNESPDDWIRYWKAWFKCKGCGIIFYEKRIEALNIIYPYIK